VDRLMTSKEVAEYLNVHPQTLDRWASKGAGPAYIKVEGNRRYSEADLKEWLNERKVRH
jgi:excisionase family DNA binding protein